MNAEDIFHAAVLIEDISERNRFLDAKCQGSVELRTKLEQSLARFQAWSESLDRFSAGLADRVAEIRLMEQTMRTAGMPEQSRQATNLTIGSHLLSYEIVGFLGAGGMGEVYLARDSRLQRLVALKVLAENRCTHDDWVSRFQREAMAASALNHPNILTIYEFGQQHDIHFIAMEYVDGLTLRCLLETNTLLLTEKLRLGIEIAFALQAAHDMNIVHRDLKPENVMIRRDGIVKILDFGIAKILNGGASSVSNTLTDNSTRPDTLMGTIRYMSPELARRQADIDFRSDMFTLGVVLYELLSGQQPFNGSSDADILVQLIESDPRCLTSFGVPEELANIVHLLLIKERTQRNSTAKQVAMQLKVILERLNNESQVSLTRQANHYAEEQAGYALPDEPDVRYTRSGEVNIAYQVLGEGEIDLVFVMGWVSHLEWFWKEPHFAQFLRSLSRFTRLILFDKRGTGLSDRVPQEQLPTLEQRMDDVRAVMDAVGSDRAVLCGVSEGGPLCALFAATYPQKTTALVMIGSYARRLKTDDYPWGPTAEQHEEFLAEIRRDWGGPVGIESRAPSMANDSSFRQWWATYLRMGASPGAALALTRMNAQIDVRPVLKTIQVPTLVLHRRGDRCLRVEEGRYLSQHIDGARFIELPGEDHLPFIGNQGDFLEPMEAFLTGVTHNSHVKRILATVMSLTFDETTATSSATVYDHAAGEVSLFRGKAYPRGDRELVATFDGPARAIRAALAIRESARRRGLPVRVGIHTGECDESESTVAGPALDVARKIVNECERNDVLISGTVKDLVAGADLRFSNIESSDSSLARLFRVG